MKTLSITAVLVFCVSLIGVASNAEAFCRFCSFYNLQQKINRTSESASAVSAASTAKDKEETELVKTADADQNSDEDVSDADEESVDACCEAIYAYDSIDCSRLPKGAGRSSLAPCIISKIQAKNEVRKQCGLDPTDESISERPNYRETQLICLLNENKLD